MTRDQKIVAGLAQAQIEELAGMAQGRQRAASLPSLIRRSGLIQTTLWLEASKEKELGLLGKMLGSGLKAVLGKESQPLAKLTPDVYLIHQDVAIAVASMIYRLVEAQRRLDGLADS